MISRIGIEPNFGLALRQQDLLGNSRSNPVQSAQRSSRAGWLQARSDTPGGWS